MRSGLLAAVLLGAVALVLVAPTSEAGTRFNNLREKERVLELYLEAESETGPAFLSTDPNATTTAVYKPPDHGVTSGAAIAQEYYTTGWSTSKSITLTARSAPGARLFLNLSAPVTGNVWWSSESYSKTSAATSPYCNYRFKVELFQGTTRIVGRDYYAFFNGLSCSARPDGWASLPFGTVFETRPEVAVIEADTPLSVKITRTQDWTDFWVGTHGTHQSVIRLQYFTEDPLSGLLYLENGLLTNLDVEAQGAGDGSFWVGGLGLAGLALLRPRRGGAALLVVLLVLGAGCVGGPSRPGSVAAPGTSPSTIERGSVENETLREKGVGSIEGKVRNGEKAGLPLRDAMVIVLGTNRFQRTGPDGSFRFLDLDPNAYQLKFDAEGFVSRQENVTVEVGRISYLNVTLLPPEGAGAPGVDYTRPHDHDLWAGESRKELLDKSYAPGSTPPFLCAESGYCRLVLPIERSRPVLPGTTSVEVTLNWDASGRNAPKAFALNVLTGQSNAQGYTYVSRGPGEMFRIAIFPHEADPGHQTFTNWEFALTSPGGEVFLYNQRSGAYLLGQLHVKIWILKGVVPLEPKHRTFWDGNSTLQVLRESVKTINGNLNGEPQATSSGGRWILRNVPGAWVPPGTQSLRLWLNWSYSGTPILGDAQWTLRYKGATQPWNSYDVQSLPLAKVERRVGNTVELSIDPGLGTDKYYQPFSYWVFVLEDGKAPHAPSVDFQLNHYQSTATFKLSVLAVRDPAYRE